MWYNISRTDGKNLSECSEGREVAECWNDGGHNISIDQPQAMLCPLQLARQPTAYHYAGIYTTVQYVHVYTTVTYSAYAINIYNYIDTCGARGSHVHHEPNLIWYSPPVVHTKIKWYVTWAWYMYVLKTTQYASFIHVYCIHVHVHVHHIFCIQCTYIHS